MKKVLIHANNSKKDIDLAITSVINILINYDCDVSFSSKYENYKVINLETFNGDFIISLGGDGTILGIIQQNVNVPILGINFGNMGFLTELEFSELKLLKKVFENDSFIDKRKLLRVKTYKNKELTSDTYGLNDVIIKTEDSFRIMSMSVFSDKTQVLNFEGDGLIISSPTGSTAYSMAAGGPIVEPECDVLCVTPICSHKFAGKSFIFSKNHELTVKIKERNSNLAYLSIDGNPPARISPENEIKIVLSDETVSFLRVKNQKFHHVLKEKIGANFNEI